VSRLWTRLSVRGFAIFVLVLALIAGVYVATSRKTQRTTAASVAEAEDVFDTKQADAADRRTKAARDAAEHEAAAKAEAVAKEAADKAKAAEDAARKKAAESSRGNPRPSSSAVPPYNGPIPASCDSYSGNRKIGCAMTLQAGFGLDQVPCIISLWDKESGWNEHSMNKGSGAYGIPQSLPGSKMSSAGSDWQNNPATQIRWGLGYITGRYKSPCGAWGFWQANHFY